MRVCLFVCVCVRHEWLLCVWFPLGWKIISHLLRPVNFTPESEAVIAVPFSNYSAIQKMLKVTSMLPLQPLGRTWKLLSMLFLTNSLLGLSVYIYCPYIEHLWMWNWVQIVLRKQRQTTKKTYSSLPKSRFFMSDMGLCDSSPTVFVWILSANKSFQFSKSWKTKHSCESQRNSQSNSDSFPTRSVQYGMAFPHSLKRSHQISPLHFQSACFWSSDKNEWWLACWGLNNKEKAKCL